MSSSLETLKNQERLDGHDKFSYLNFINGTGERPRLSERIVYGELKSLDFLVNPKDDTWNPMVVVIASCCIGMLTLPRLVTKSHGPEFKVRTSIYLQNAADSIGLIICTVFLVRNRRFQNAVHLQALFPRYFS